MDFIRGKQLYPRLSIHILDSMGILGKRGAAKGTRECGCREQRQPHYLRPIGRKDCQVITFNYTSYASQTSPTALYFHGSLKEYVDVENKNDFLHDDLTTIDLEDFFKNQLAAEISFDPDHKSIPIPSFLPPLKLRPVISKHYIDTWYHASQMVLRASKIIILGYSFSSADNYFCDMLRENHDAQIIIIDKNMETASRNVCRCLQLDANRYTKQIRMGMRYANTTIE